MGAAQLWARSMARGHRLASWLLIALVVISSGVVMAAVAAERRANGSVARFNDMSRDIDANVYSCPPGVDPNSVTDQTEVNRLCLSEDRAEVVATELATLPGVERVSVGGSFVVGVLDPKAANGWGHLTLLTA